MRKHAFGSAIVFGENNKSTISGVWIWKGHDLAFEVRIVCLVVADNAMTPYNKQELLTLVGFTGHWSSISFTYVVY